MADLRRRFGRSEEDLIAALTTGGEASEKIRDIVKRLRPAQLRRVLAMTPAERIDRAFSLTELAHSAGTAHVVRE